MENGRKTTRVPRESFKARAYRIIEGKILGGELRPGDVLDRRSMAMQLKMSVAPVLEAMLLLTEEGLLETRPRSLTRVRKARPEDVLARHWVREALECQAARMIYGDPIKNNFARLLPLARAVDAARFANKTRWRSESEFHVALAALVGSDGFLATFRKNVSVGLFYEFSTMDAAKNAEGSATTVAKSHVTLLEGLRDAKTPEEAEAIARDHLNSGKSFFVRETEARERI